MRRLLLLLYKYRAFLTFVLLEVICAWLVIQNNSYQGAAFFNSSNRISASLLNSSSTVSDYFSLKEVNEQLAQENAKLRKALQGSTANQNTPSVEKRDSLLLQQYQYTAAKVIKNTTLQNNNYITIDKGWMEGIRPGMGVICPEGIVGQVKSVSKHFSLIASLLHRKMIISSKIKRTDNFCSVNWDGKDPYTGQLLYVMRHIGLREGDTITTSGYDAIFPEGTLIGRIKKYDVPKNASFYEVDITLATDFNRLSYVYVVKNEIKQEKDSLENNTLQLNE